MEIDTYCNLYLTLSVSYDTYTIPYTICDTTIGYIHLQLFLIIFRKIQIQTFFFS